MPNSPLKVIPLGGLGEIGQNMMVFEYEDNIVVVDAGVLFPEEDMPGIDFAIPDISYLIENQDKIRAILITHGHEDHIGALPYVLRELDVPVYASRLTHGLITVKLREHNLLKKARLNIVEPNAPFKMGPFKVEFFRVCHSIPDAMGIAITTPQGMIVHTGDFKIDHTPADGMPSDLSTLANMTSEGVLLLCSDSTYAEVPGFTESEKLVGDAFDRIIGDAEGRVLIATFASLISRVQQAIIAAEKYGRHVAVVGRSMSNNVKMALSMGYLKAQDGTLVNLNETRRLKPEEIIILATGSQGEPTSALVRIANGSHQDVDIEEGDTVIISASPIPGNEKVVAKTIDNLYRRGAKVLYSRIALVHVHGHASQEELKTILSLVKPKYLVPVHGEYRHLVTHAAIGQSMGIPESNTFVLEDGDVLEIDEEYAGITDHVTAGHVFVDGRTLWDMESNVLKERKRLARDGVVTIVVTVDSEEDEVVGDPEIVTSGFVELDEFKDLFEKTSKMVVSALEGHSLHPLEFERAKTIVTEQISSFLYKETRRRPTVLTVFKEV